jgi:hypothetical protein
MHRRELIKLTAVSAMLARLAGAAELAPAPALPAAVAGVPLPRSRLAREAAAFARQRCPEFLFNHCMRTFTFGALLLQRRRRAFDAETAFVASALHDLGLLQPFESSHGSFEVDGADAAEKFVLQQHAPAALGDRVWHAVEMHDGHWALTARQGPEAMLVALGAGADVYGPEPGDFDHQQVAEILAAFPRQQFKQGFTALLIAHCERKPDSQHGTWLEGVCRRHASGAEEQSVEQRIAAAPFPE